MFSIRQTEHVAPTDAALGRTIRSQCRKRRWMLRSLIVTALLSVFALSSVALAQEPAQVDIGKGVAGNVTEVANGTIVEYLIFYSCTSIVTSCEGTTIVDTLPPGAVYVDSSLTQHVQEVIVDSPSPGQVTYVFDDPLPGGSSGVITVQIMFPPGTIPADLPTNPVTNTAVIDADNAAAMTATAPITLTDGTVQIDANKRQISPDTGEVVIGVPVVYELEFCNIDNEGAVEIVDPIMTDVLPPGATFVSAEPNGTYDPATNSVTWTNLTPNPLPVGECITRTISIVFNEMPPLPDPPDPPVIYNTMVVTSTPDGCQPGRVTDPPPAYCEGLDPLDPTIVITDDIPIEVIDPFGRWGMDKSATADSTYENTTSQALPGEQITYDLHLVNSGFLSITNVVITDTLPPEVLFDEVTISPFSSVNGHTVSYSLRTAPNIFIPFPAPGPYYTQTVTVTRADLVAPLPPDTEIDIAYIRWEISGTVEPGQEWTAQILATVRDGTPEGTLIQNCVDVSGETIDGTVTGGDCDWTEVINERSIPRIRKARTSDPSVVPLETVAYSITVFNPTQAHLPAVGPVMMDLLPPELEYVPGSFVLSSVSPPTVTTPITIEAISDFQPGRTLLRAIWDPAALLHPGDNAVFAFEAIVAEGTPPGVLTNTANLLTLDQPDLTFNCTPPNQYVDVDDLNGNLDTTEEGCSSNASVAVNIQLNLDTQKYIRGQYDTEWETFGRTPEFGYFDYRLVLTNTSNVALDVVGLLDILPVVGDRGVIDPAARGTEWRATLQSEITGPPGIPMTVWYSPSSNPCRPLVIPGGGSGCEPPNWTLTPPLDLANQPDLTLARSVIIYFCSGGTIQTPTGCYNLPRDSAIAIEWRMSTPVNELGHADCLLDYPDVVNSNCPIAWNSFAFGASAQGVNFRPAEPPKVGIGLVPTQDLVLGDFVWADLAAQPYDGIQQPGELGLDGQRVVLLDANDDSVLQTVLTGPDVAGRSGYYRFLLSPATDHFLKVAFAIPEYSYPSPANQGADDELDSNGVVTTTLAAFPGVQFVVTDPFTFSLPITEDLSIDQGFWYPLDWGDAPQGLPGVFGNYPTVITGTTDITGSVVLTAAARHIVSNVPGLTIRLGAFYDDELDGQPTAFANGDDLAPGLIASNNGTLSDEDGVTFPFTVAVGSGFSGIFSLEQVNSFLVSTVIQTVPARRVRLEIWVDLDRDGIFDVPAERINSSIVTNGNQSRTLNLVGRGAAGPTYMRVRLAEDTFLTGPGGLAVYGEVEDYLVQIIGAPVKSIVATSEAHTPPSTQALGNNTELAVGEIVRYRLTAQLPRGDLTNFRITDTLPIGLQYLGNPIVTLTATVPSSITPSIFTPTVTPIGAGSFGSGTDVLFSFGNISNHNVMTDVEYVNLEFNALVLNDQGNQDTTTATSRRNTFTVAFNNYSRISNNIDILIQEPQLTMTKGVATIPPIDAGDSVTYTLRVDAAPNPAGGRRTDAFDVVISDTIDSRLTLAGPVGIVTSAGVFTVTDTTAGNLVTINAGRMAPGSAITVTIRATVANTAQAGATILNRARTTWTSLPGPNGTTTNPTGQSTPGASGSATGERDGSNVPPLLNNYRVEATASFRIAQPAITKLPPPRPTWTIGEYITYTLVITTPEGTTQNLVISDLLPAGLGFQSSQVITTAAASGGLLAADYPGNVTNVTPTASGTTWSWNFGNVVNPGDNNRTNNRFLIQVRVVVLNVIGNQHGTNLTNTGRLVYTDGTNGNTTLNTPAVTVNVVEPTLRITKAAVHSPTADAGDLVTYTLTLRHSPTSTITAWNVRLTDTVPADLVSPLFVAARYSNGTPVADVGFTDNSLRMLNPTGTINLPYTETVTITYTARFADSARPGEAITNRAGAVWASLPDVTTNPQRRWDGVGSPNGQDLIDSNALNNYEVNATAVASPSQAYTITKHLINSDALHTVDPNLTIGESVTYTLRVTVTEGTLLTTTVSDALPAGLRLVSSEVITTANARLGLANDFAGSMAQMQDNSSGNTMAWNFGTILNPGDNDLDNNTFLIRIQAVVENVIGNQQPGTRSNTGTLSIENTPRTSNAVVVNIDEPTLQIDKSVVTAVPNPDAGDLVTYTVVVRHAAGSIAAQDVVISDTLPALLVAPTLLSAESSESGSIGGQFTGNFLRVPASGSVNLTATEVITAVFTARISDAMLPGVAIVNTACTTWASLPDGLNDADRRTDGDGLITGDGLNNYEVCDDAIVTPSAAYDIHKTLIESDALHTTDPDLTIGESVTYTLRVTMTEGTHLDTSVVDVLPAGMRLVSQEVITAATPSLGLLQEFPGSFSAPSFSSSGNTLTWEFGTVVNPGDNEPDNDVFLIRIQAVVENVIGNQQPGTRVNRATLTVAGSPRTSNDVTVNIVEPTLGIDKSVATDPLKPVPDAGDTITYTVVIRHVAPSIDAQDVIISDTLPASLDNFGTPEITSSLGRSITGSIVGNLLRVPAGSGTLVVSATEVITIVYTAHLSDNIEAGIPVVNGACTTWASLPDGLNDADRRIHGDGLVSGSGLNNYETCDLTSFVPDHTHGIVKRLVESDASHTTDPDITIGESLTYTLRITMTEGTQLLVRVEDILPPGLRLTAQEVITEARPDLGLLQDFPGSFADNTFENNDNTLTWDFGTIVNPGDNNPDNDAFLIRIQAVVENVIGNQQPGTRTNSATLQINSQIVPSNDVDIDIVEPTLDIAKSVTTDPLKPVPDAGDTMTYTVVVRHTPPSINAQDVIITDTLPGTLDNFGTPDVTSSLGRTLSGSIAGNVLRVPAGSGSTVISATEVITIVYTAEIADTMQAGVPIVNDICTTWASLPDGLNDADRRLHGDGLNTGTGLNNYEACDSAPFTPGGDYEISKHLIESDASHTVDPNLTIGESVTYTLRITVTEGTWISVRITDVLPAGLRLTAQEVITTADAAVGLNSDFAGSFSSDDFTATPTPPTNTLVWTLGTLVNPGDNNSDNDTFVVRIQAVVENVIGNQQPGVRTNSATLGISGNMLPSNPVDIAIVEPTLEIDKSVETDPLKPVPDAGDTVTYTVVVRHAAGSIAGQDVVITDTLPATLDNPIVVSMESSEGTSLSNAIAGQMIRIPASGSLTLTETEVITVVFTAVVGNNAQAGVPITNNVCTTWASLPDGLNDADRRTHGNGLVGQGGLNDYETCDSAIFTPGGSYQISKALDGSSATHTTDPDVTIGEVVTYSLRITMTEETWTNTIVTDALPAGLVYLGGSVALDTTGFGGTVSAPGVTPPAANPNGGGNLVLNFGTVVVNGNNDPSDNAFTVRFQARVLNVAGNEGLPGAQTILTNSASISAGGLPPVDSNDVDIVVVEPRMEIVKEMTPTVAPPQSLVEVTIVVSNTGLSTAFESSMIDVVPAGLTYVPGTLAEPTNNGIPAALDDSGAPTLVAQYSVFPTNTQSILTFNATIDANAVPGTIIVNTATIEGATTLPGDDPNERTEPSDSDDATVEIITHDLVLTKTNGQDDYVAGGLLTYTLTITNVGQAVAPGVTITEIVPVPTTFVTTGSTPGWTNVVTFPNPCADGDPAGTTCILSVGDIQPNQSLSVTFVVRVDNPLPSPAPTITNAACVDDDGTLGQDPTPANNCDDHDNNFLLAQLGDRVWLDANGNGVQDAGEGNYAGMIVNLLNPITSAVISTTTSAADGSYYFTNLPPGAYRVFFEPPITPAGVRDPVITFQHQGTDPTVDSDAGRPDGNTQVILLTSGEVNHTIDAGVYYLSALGDFVWHDLNANGIQESGENGIRGVTMYLIVNNTIVATTTTNFNGFYIFSDLDFGTYSVRMGDTPGYLLSPSRVGTDDLVDSDFAVDTRETRQIVIDQAPVHFMDLDGGLHQLASLGDRVWSDTNANGVQEAGEPGIPNVTLTLTSTTYPALNLTTSTTITGSYHFTGLVPGEYVVRFAQPPRHFPSPRFVGDPATDSNADPATGFSNPVTLISAQEDPSIDAGFYPASTLGDFVWEDMNANGIQEAGEPGIANVGVELLQGGVVVSTTTTNALGLYQFGNLPLGTYAVRMAEIPGWRVTLQNQGSDDQLDSDIDPVTRTSGDIAIPLPGHYPNNDAGFYEPAELGDLTWHDRNANGIQESGEPPLADVTVVLERPDGTPVTVAAVSAAATIVTPASGLYTFTGLTPGEYVVHFTPPATFRTTLQHVGDPALDSDPSQTTGRTQVITLVSGDRDDSIDAGYFQPAQLGSYVWMDLNINGIRESGEPPVDEVIVNLYREGDTSPWRTTTTDANGNFLFTELPPGRYRLRFDPPTGLAFTWRNVGSDPMANSDVNPVNGETDLFTLADAQTDLTWGAGLIVPTADNPAPEPEGGWEFRSWLPAVQGE